MPEFKLKRLEDAAVHNVILNRVLPHPQLLVPTILIPIIHFHALLYYSITPLLHHSITPLLPHSTTPALHFFKSAARLGKRCLCQARFRLRFCRGGPQRSFWSGTFRCQYPFSWWFEKVETGSAE